MPEETVSLPVETPSIEPVSRDRQAGCGWGGTRWAWVLFLVLVLLMMGTWGGQWWGI